MTKDKSTYAREFMDIDIDIDIEIEGLLRY